MPCNAWNCFTISLWSPSEVNQGELAGSDNKILIGTGQNLHRRFVLLLMQKNIDFSKPVAFVNCINNFEMNFGSCERNIFLFFVNLLLTFIFKNLKKMQSHIWIWIKSKVASLDYITVSTSIFPRIHQKVNLIISKLFPFLL